MPPDSRYAAPYLRALFDHLPIGVVLADDEGRYIDANAAACAIYERDLDQMIGLSVRDLVPRAEGDAVEMQWQAFLRDGEQAGVFDMTLPSGATRRVQFHAHARFAPGLHCSFVQAVDASPAIPQSDSAVLTLCAWTKRVKLGGEWISIERYLAESHGVHISHGMAPDVFHQLKKDLESR